MLKKIYSIIIVILILTLSSITAICSDDFSVILWNADTTGIMFDFSCRLDVQSFESGIHLKKDGIDIKTQAKITQDCKTLLISPCEGMNFDCTYTFTVGKDLKNEQNQSFDKVYQKSFILKKLYYDTFDDDRYASAPANYSIENGVFTSSGEVDRLKLNSANSSLYPKSKWESDYTTEADIKLETIGSAIGIYVRANDFWRYYNENSKYYVDFKYSVATVMAPSTQLLATSTTYQDITDGNYHHVRIAFKGNNIKVFMDDNKIIDFNDDTILTPGAFGLNTAGNVILDDFYLTSAKEVEVDKPKIENMNLTVSSDYSSLNATYEFKSNSEDESTYCILTSNTKDGEYTIKETKKIETSGVINQILDESYNEKFIKIRINPKNKDGIYGDDFESASIAFLFKPTIKEIKINGTVQSGESITATYVYYDENNDFEGTSSYQWYMSEDPEGEYVKIDKATSLMLNIDDVLENKFLKFYIIPTAVSYPHQGNEFQSDYVASIREPIAKNVVISGESALLSTLSATYEYFDYNKQEEDKTVFRWLCADNIDGDYQPILGEVTEKYVIKATDIDKYFIFEVTPKKNNKSGKPYRSAPFVSPSTPIAKNIEMSGIIRSENTVVGVYDYFQTNHAQQGDSIMKWYIDGVVVSNEKMYTIKKEDEGKNIFFEVTPVSKVEPFVGKSAKSKEALIPIEKIDYDPPYSGGGSSSSGKVVSEIVQKVENAVENGANLVTKFTDIPQSPYRTSIIKLYDKGYINGVNDKEFQPLREITRAEFATLIVNYLKIKQPKYSNCFKDVTENEWYAKNIQAISDKELICGYEGFFRPNDTITFEEMLKIIVQTYKLDGRVINEDDSIKADNTSEWAIPYVTSAISAGLYKNKEFDTKKNVVREVAALILERLIEKRGEN